MIWHRVQGRAGLAVPGSTRQHSPYVPTHRGIDVNTRGITIGVIFAGLLTTGACVQRLPRRVSGSDLTLPEPHDRAFLRSLMPRCNDADTTSGTRDPGSRCGGASSDTMRSTSDPISPPPQKTP
jgi:hypothetical protein